jgi:UDP:flavonoid glycosyltransferase YjiC (YdhE family)
VPAGDDVFTARAVPHELVLPRVAVAVHHGGAGTTTAVARAGVPQVVLPHILDQFYWAHRVQSLFLGPRALPVDLVNADVLTDRLVSALNDPRIDHATAELGRAVAARDGTQAAVDALERLAGDGR